MTYKDYLPKKAIENLESHLRPHRYQHSIGVCETAFMIAHEWKGYEINWEKLAWAGLFHDCAKELKYDEIGQLVMKGLTPYGLELMQMKRLSHAPLGAAALKYWYGVNDDEIHLAVAYHPTGSPQMTTIGWLVYLADYLEPNRTYFEERAEILQKACDDPLTGLKMVADLRIKNVMKKGRPVNPLGIKFKEYLDTLTVLEPRTMMSDEEILW